MFDGIAFYLTDDDTQLIEKNPPHRYFDIVDIKTYEPGYYTESGGAITWHEATTPELHVAIGGTIVDSNYISTYFNLPEYMHVEDTVRYNSSN